MKCESGYELHGTEPCSHCGAERHESCRGLPAINGRIEERKKAALHDELVEALRPFAKFACSPPGECDCNNCRAAAVLAKAKGE